jgi:hypothetical protein
MCNVHRTAAAAAVVIPQSDLAVHVGLTGEGFGQQHYVRGNRRPASIVKALAIDGG